MPDINGYLLGWQGRDAIPTMDEVAAKFDEITGRTAQGEGLEDTSHSTLESILKGESRPGWEDHKAQMAQLSRNWPHTLFKLDFPRDTWREYYLNGKVQRVYANITYPEFDFMQMVEPDELD